VKRLVVGAVAVVMLAGSVEAQRPGGGGRPPREELEAEVRRQFARAVQTRVGLTAEQMQKLGPMNERHAIARRRLQMDERATRMELQFALRSAAPADTAVNRLLGRLVEIQKQRVQLMEREQGDLATIMTPVQRARFMAMQEQLRRRMDERRGAPPVGEGSGGGGGNRPPPRRRPPPGR
jgi:Spy/CpxP family protein refolding chaperone